MIKIRKYIPADAEGMIDIWNDIVRDGIAFPQDEELTIEQGNEFFLAQSFTGIAVDTEAG